MNELDDVINEIECTSNSTQIKILATEDRETN